MAGHSKFKKIMHRKGAQDIKRGKIFARIAREITIAAGLGLPDPEKNPRLRAALALARAQNMPKENVKKAIDKASGGDHGDNLDEVLYEGYGPGGIAILIETLTDNRNRTASEVRSTLTKFGGNLGESGSVSFMFDHMGLISYPAKIGYEQAFEFGVENGAEDVVEEDGSIQFIAPMELFGSLRDACLEKFGDPEDQKLLWIPQNTIALDDEEKMEKLQKILDKLEEIDDVQEVFCNAE